MSSIHHTQPRWLASFRLTLLASSLVLLSAGYLAANAQTAPDNSGTNKAQDQGRTADQQPNDSSDLQLTAKIRRLVMADKSLSTYGHNVKIIVHHGAVTLKGPVHSQEEKQTIDEKAAQIVGQDKVTDRMTVK